MSSELFWAHLLILTCHKFSSCRHHMRLFVCECWENEKKNSLLKGPFFSYGCIGLFSFCSSSIVDHIINVFFLLFFCCLIKTKSDVNKFFDWRAYSCVLYAWLQMTNCSVEYVDQLNAKIKMPKLWSCITPKSDEEKRREQINKQINAKLKQDEKIYKATYRLLLLGKFNATNIHEDWNFSFQRRWWIRKIHSC